MGYQYELLQDLANKLGLKLELEVSNNLEKDFDDLANHKVDLLAINLTVTAERQTLMNFTSPIMETRQVLVQQLAEFQPNRQSSFGNSRSESRPVARFPQDIPHQQRTEILN